MTGFLNTGRQQECYGCESCVQTCPKNAVTMQEDTEGFRYPIVNNDLCIQCGACHAVCPHENPPTLFTDDKIVFGGYHKDITVRAESTSGGAFTAIAEGWCDRDTVIFGARVSGLEVFHDHVIGAGNIHVFRKSKYSQSKIGTAYRDASRFLKENKKVLFSGTPCQIAGLKAFLGSQDQTNLLTVEVVCEGVPSPLFVRSYDREMQRRYGSSIAELDYRFKDLKRIGRRQIGKWDFQVMRTILTNGLTKKLDRWFNPFWSIWLKHLMSRPSCYQCRYASPERCADITLGDLWGVHLYCPELYGHNTGASLIICSSEKGRAAYENAKQHLHGHELKFSDALKYQGPMRASIKPNAHRAEFLKDAESMDYRSLCKKWADPPSAKLLWQKYVWGNRQKIWFWNLKHKGRKPEGESLR